MIDRSMSYEHYIDTICCIVSGTLSLLRRTKPYLNFYSALRFYNCCVNKYFIYCSAAWGNCFRSVLGVYSLMPTSLRLFFSLFLKLKWIPFFDLIKYRKIFMLFSILLNPNAPNCLGKRFQFLSDSRKLENCNRLLRLPLNKVIHSFIHSYSTMSLEIEYGYVEKKSWGSTLR